MEICSEVEIKELTIIIVKDPFLSIHEGFLCIRVGSLNNCYQLINDMGNKGDELLDIVSMMEIEGNET